MTERAPRRSVQPGTLRESTTMFRLLAVVAVVALSGAVDANILTQGDVANKFYVHYDLIPDVLFHKRNFYVFPRTEAEAKNDNFKQVGLVRDDHTRLFCRNGEYTACVLLDNKGSIAGIQLSVSVADIEKSNLPFDMNDEVHWKRQTIYDTDVYSATTYFVSEEVLANGGRDLTSETLTAPEGVFMLQTDRNGVETGRVHVTNDEKDAESVNFNEQACFHGMGKHYFQKLTKQSSCEAERGSYFSLYNKSKKLQGFGFTAFGKKPSPPAGSRNYFENPPALVVKMIAPNSPACLTQWVNKYGIFTMHVFFVDRAYNTWC